MDDMRLLLAARLKGTSHIAPADVAQAVDLLQAKSEVGVGQLTCLLACHHNGKLGCDALLACTALSLITAPSCTLQGQLIYAKYALEFMAFKRDGAWSLQQLGACLPHGLYGAYELSMHVLVSRLAAERPDLVALLHGKVLPVLVAMQAPLSTEQVAWACGAWPAAWPMDHPAAQAAASSIDSAAPKEADVALLLDLLTNIFPHRPAHNQLGRGSSQASDEPAQVVYPYHKSVLDWLTDASAGDYRVDASAGHGLLALRCVPYCHQALTLGDHPWLRVLGADSADMALNSATAGLPPSRFVEPNDYALRHFAAHMAAAPATSASLAAGVLTDYKLVEAVFCQGGGHAFVRDMGTHARHPAATDEARDGHRWLQVGVGCMKCLTVEHSNVKRSAFHTLSAHPQHTSDQVDGVHTMICSLQFFRHLLLKDPSAALTTALMSPITTWVFKCAEAAAVQMAAPKRQWRTLAAMVWTKWPALMETLEVRARAHVHTHGIYSVCMCRAAGLKKPCGISGAREGSPARGGHAACCTAVWGKVGGRGERRAKGSQPCPDTTAYST
jgi:hypothetical protein